MGLSTSRTGYWTKSARYFNGLLSSNASQDSSACNPCKGASISDYSNIDGDSFDACQMVR